jgi:hypothetical protein
MDASSTGRHWLTIHAGTHKTATSYIQSRIASNRRQLRRLGLMVPYPSGPARKHKPLAVALGHGCWQPWRDLLRGASSNVLLSGEQFTQPLADPANLESLLQVLGDRHYRLRIVVFLRDQPDYINARYVHSTRRLYHHQDFESYVRFQLAERRHVYDYDYLFGHLTRHPAITSVFLPYGSCFGDPFVRMMEALGLPESPMGWAPSDPDKGNVQPGCRGVWFAQTLSKCLAQLGVDGSRLTNTGAVVRHIAEQQGWQDERYCGFDKTSAEAVSAFYAESNDRFAQRVWNCRWRERVPVVPMERCVFDPPPAGGEEERRLERLVLQALQDLSRQNRRLSRALKASSPTIGFD